jgi:CBS domain-containing protein
VEATAETAAAALGGLRVRDVMIPGPDTGAEWISVAAFIERIVPHSAQTAFPVTAFDGPLAGVTTLAMLTRLPPRRRADATLRQVMVPAPPSYLAAPEDPAAPLITRPPLTGEVAAVVTTEGRVIGIVTIRDLRVRAGLRPRGPSSGGRA